MKYSGLCGNQQQYKAILESSTVSTPDGITKNSPINVGTFGGKWSQAYRSLWINFKNYLMPNQKKAICWLWFDKIKCKSIIKVKVLWYNINKRRGNTKINAQVKNSLYIWVLHHPQVVQSPISNKILKIYINGNT